MKASPEAIARAKRDRMAVRLLLWAFLPLVVLYFIVDGIGLLPAVVSVRIRAERRGRAELTVRTNNIDPDTVLGIPIGDTRFRLNYTNGHAIVTRPLFGVEEWIVPAHFTYQGMNFTVTALDTFAVLNATHAHTISLPPTIEHLNGAPELAGEALKCLILRREDGSETRFTFPRPESAPPIE
jgi:hypothetical protein